MVVINFGTVSGWLYHLTTALMATDDEHWIPLFLLVSKMKLKSYPVKIHFRVRKIMRKHIRLTDGTTTIEIKITLVAFLTYKIDARIRFWPSSR